MAAKAPKVRARRQLPAVIAGEVTPKTEQHRAFCEAWLRHYDNDRAAKEAGFNKSGYGTQLFIKFQAYLVRMKEKKEAVVMKELALEQKDILQAMLNVARCNPQDFVETYVEPGVEGKPPVTKERFKSLLQLTPEQAAMVSDVAIGADGRMTYTLPGAKTKHTYWKDLGQHLGLFHPKLIQEHRHEHRQRALSFRGVDPAQLAEFERELLKVLGPEGKRLLGIRDAVDAEFEDITDQS